MGPTQVQFCAAVTARLRDCILAAKPESPLRQAFDGLGDGFFEVACKAVSRHSAEHIYDHHFLARFIKHGADGCISIQSTITSIVAATVRDCIRAWQHQRSQAVAS